MSREPVAANRISVNIPYTAQRRALARHGAHRDERGQISIVGAILVVVLLGVVYAVAVIGSAMIDRQAAVIAADATALASALGDEAGVVERYRSEGIEVQAAQGRSDSVVGSVLGPGEWSATASSRAQRDDTLDVAPALVAVVARAEQVLGRRLAPVLVEGITLELVGADASEFAGVAADLRMCPVMARTPGASAWVLC